LAYHLRHVKKIDGIALVQLARLAKRSDGPSYLSLVRDNFQIQDICDALRLGFFLEKLVNKEF